MLIVEDGTGKPDANTFADTAFVTSFYALRGGNVTWTGATGAEQIAGCALATDYLCDELQFRYRGARGAGALPWPRVGASYRQGGAIPDNVVPHLLRVAVALLAPRAIVALRAGTTLKPPQERGGAIASESLTGVASVTYRDDAPTHTVHDDVVAALSPLLRETVVDDSVPRVVVSASDPAGDPALRAATFADPASAPPGVW